MSSEVQGHSKPGAFTRMKNAFFWEPRAGEKIPAIFFFKHRYVRAAAYLLMCLGCTLVYYGWQPFSQMLFRKGAYRWQCDPAELEGPEDYCTAQYNSVQSLFTTGLSCEFIFGVVAGVLLDHIGPWFTAFLGSAMFFSGWLCFIYSSQSVNAYVPGMVLLAGSVNLVAFPCLSVSDFFPKWKGLTMSLVVAAQTACTMVAPILKGIWDKHPQWVFSSVIWGYLLSIYAPFTVFYLLCVPWKRPSKRKDIVEVQCDEADAQTELELYAAPIEDHAVDEKYDVAVKVVENKAAGYTFLQQLFSIEYLAFTVYYIMQVMMYGYYPTTVLDQFGEKVSDFQGWILPSQAVFGALFGLVVDRVLTVPISAVLTASMTSAMGLALVKNTGWQYVTSVLYVVSNSYIYTVKYTYIAELYPPTHFGVLIGTMGCVAGVVTLANVPIQNLNKYTGTCIAFIVVGFCCFACLAFCWYRQKRGYNYLSAAPEEQAPTKGIQEAEESQCEVA